MKVKWHMRGSMTVEATLVFPLFFFVIVGFLYFFQIFQTQTRIQGYLTEIGQEASRYAYVYDALTKSEEGEKVSKKDEQEVDQEVKDILTRLVEGSYYKLRFKQLVKGEAELKGVVGGLNGVSFLSSSFMEKEGIIEVVASYQVKIPVPFFSHFSFPVVQQIKTRGFIGASLIKESEDSQGEGEDEEYVYITRTGTVYHSHQSCTYLNPKITSVSAKALETLRNKSGGIYYPCEACCQGHKEQPNYYITQYGNRYHTSKLCNKIDRDVKTIKKSEVGGRRACSKCYK